MKILLVGVIPEILEILSALIQSEVECEIVRAESGNEAISILKSNKGFDIIYSDYNMPDSSGAIIYKYNIENGNVPFILVSAESLKDCVGFPHFHEVNKLNKIISKPIDLDELLDSIKSLDLDHVDDISTHSYCRVSFALINLYPLAEYEVYIKLSEEKFVKIKDCHEEDNLDMEKYEQKGSDGLYLEHENFLDYISKAIMIQHQKMSLAPSPMLQIEICGENIELMHDGLVFLGLQSEQLLFLNTTIEVCFESLLKEPSLKGQIQLLLESKGYFLSHSITAGYLAYLISLKLSLGQESITKKFLYAAILHDVTLKDSELCMIYDLESSAFTELSSLKKKLVKHHPFECVKLLKDIDFIPSDVLTIIKEHHEFPNGRGYPRGVNETNMSVLSLIFIFALKLSDHLYFHGHSKQSLDKFIITLQDEGFHKGPSEKIYNAIVDMI